MFERTLIMKWIVTALIAFVVRQLEKFGKATDWTKVKADFAVRVAQLVPGTWFDAEAVSVSNAIVDKIAKILEQPKTVGIILQLVADGKLDEAAKKLREIMLKVWVTGDDVAAGKAKSYVENAA